MRRRPSRHIRHVKTRHGHRRRLINSHIRKKRKYSVVGRVTDESSKSRDYFEPPMPARDVNTIYRYQKYEPLRGREAHHAKVYFDELVDERANMKERFREEIPDPGYNEYEDEDAPPSAEGIMYFPSSSFKKLHKRDENDYW